MVLSSNQKLGRLMMKTKGLLLILAMMFVVGCASTPKTSDMRQLFSMEVGAFLEDKTVVMNFDWGEYAFYTDSNMKGVGRSSGDWGQDIAKFTISVTDSGEYCTKYEYDANLDYTDPKYEYCSKLYQGPEGEFYSVVTKNTRNTKRVGNVRLLNISDGDTLGLM